ncbi:hypothetical protein AB0J38_41060 [Streptomyces sp. NPDC050095]|uniref:hypothetical protein n=1 Tax=unclassified Streptomyces TaxID=2593676 RepID=UPI00341409B1
MPEMLETYEVTDGLVLFVGRSFFKVTEVREPSHPMFPGLTFEGHYFDSRRNVWGRKSTLGAEYGEAWKLSSFTDFPDKYIGAYLEPGELAVIEDLDNGAWVWTPAVKCQVVDFREAESTVTVTGESCQFVRGSVIEVPTARLYKREHSKYRKELGK